MDKVASMSPYTPPQTPSQPSERFSIAKAALVLILTIVIAASSILMVGPQIIVIVPVALLAGIVFALRRSYWALVCFGYQGWFTAPDDGAQRGCTHYSRRGRFEPGYCTIDLWPDMSDLDEDEKFPTAFRHADGSVAFVFSSVCRKTVLRHFGWMKEYGIDGAFVQRFAVQTYDPLALNHCNSVLMHCREGADLHGRAYAVMYDLSGLRAGQMRHVMDDWKSLVDGMRMGVDEGAHSCVGNSNTRRSLLSCTEEA